MSSYGRYEKSLQGSHNYQSVLYFDLEQIRNKQKLLSKRGIQATLLKPPLYRNTQTFFSSLGN